MSEPVDDCGLQHAIERGDLGFVDSTQKSIRDIAVVFPDAAAHGFNDGTRVAVSAQVRLDALAHVNCFGGCGFLYGSGDGGVGGFLAR